MTCRLLETPLYTKQRTTNKTNLTTVEFRTGYVLCIAYMQKTSIINTNTATFRLAGNLQPMTQKYQGTSSQQRILLRTSMENVLHKLQNDEDKRLTPLAAPLGFSEPHYNLNNSLRARNGARSNHTRTRSS